MGKMSFLMAFFPALFFLGVLVWVGYLGERVVPSSETSDPTPATVLVAFLVLFLVMLCLLSNLVALALGLVVLIGRRHQRLLAVLGIALSVSVLTVAHFQNVVWTPLTSSQATPAPQIRHVGELPPGDNLPFNPRGRHIH